MQNQYEAKLSKKEDPQHSHKKKKKKKKTKPTLQTMEKS